MNAFRIKVEVVDLKPLGTGIRCLLTPPLRV